MSKINRKVLLGIASLMLFTLGILFGVSFSGNPSYGDRILKFIGLGPWSNIETGLHYTAIMFHKQKLRIFNNKAKRFVGHSFYEQNNTNDFYGCIITTA